MKYLLLLLLVGGCTTLGSDDHSQCLLKFETTECWDYKTTEVCSEEMRDYCD